MENRLSLFSEIQSFENVVNKVRVTISMEYNTQVVEHVKNELNSAASLRAVAECAELQELSYTYAKYLNDFPEVLAEVETNLKYNIYPSEKTVNFVGPFGFYMNKLENKFGNLN